MADSIFTDAKVRREAAQKFLEDGICELSRAFNFLEEDQIYWATSAETRRRYLELMRDIVGLFHECELPYNEGHVRHLAALRAKRDPGVQSLIRKAMRKTPIRAKKPGATATKSASGGEQ